MKWVLRLSNLAAIVATYLWPQKDLLLTLGQVLSGGVSQVSKLPRITMNLTISVTYSSIVYNSTAFYKEVYTISMSISAKRKQLPPCERYRWCCRSNRSVHHWGRDRLTPAPAAPPQWWRGSPTGSGAPRQEVLHAVKEPWTHTHRNIITDTKTVLELSGYLWKATLLT